MDVGFVEVAAAPLAYDVAGAGPDADFMDEFPYLGPPNNAMTGAGTGYGAR